MLSSVQLFSRAARKTPFAVGRNLSRNSFQYNSMSSKKIHVEVTSDNVCPWCFVGKRNLEKAIGKRDDVEVVFKPFFLNPDQTEEYPLIPYLKEKFGEARMNMIMPRLQEAGRGAGINFNENRLSVPTLLSHRLNDFALKESKEKQQQVVEALMKAYFEDAKNINNLEVLVSIGETNGLKGVREYLQSNQGADEVTSKAREASRANISGVPFFKISNEAGKQIQVSGAQPPETFSQAIAQLSSSKI
eukprot:TRINITY_DN4327_c0_g1_i2.p1 TRINITY_DN4327_c0_g1~~TRINITY_DN4327_c0_g1_i2.p1  ORF type:complete len:246 (+),score=49.53 TRINITY_DN4327_c0_g1_i2:73-810(+)